MVRRNEDNDKRTEQFRKLFIGGLTPSTNEDLLQAYYGQWGQIVDVVVMKDNKTKRSRGFGFITYKDAEMVDIAQSNRPHIIDGKTVEAKRAMPREDSGKPEAHMTVKKLFVGALKKDVRTTDLHEYFSHFGNITDCEVVTWKETGESRGFGFVTFDDYDPVDKVILYKPHNLKSSRADVKKALSKDEMQKVKQKQEQQVMPQDFPPQFAMPPSLPPTAYASSGSHPMGVSIGYMPQVRALMPYAAAGLQYQMPTAYDYGACMAQFSNPLMPTANYSELGMNNMYFANFEQANSQTQIPYSVDNGSVVDDSQTYSFSACGTPYKPASGGAAVCTGTSPPEQPASNANE